MFFDVGSDSAFLLVLFQPVRQREVVMLRLKRECQISQARFEIEARGDAFEKSFGGKQQGIERDLKKRLRAALPRMIQPGQFCRSRQLNSGIGDDAIH